MASAGTELVAAVLAKPGSAAPLRSRTTAGTAATASATEAAVAHAAYGALQASGAVILVQSLLSQHLITLAAVQREQYVLGWQ